MVLEVSLLSHMVVEELVRFVSSLRRRDGIHPSDAQMGRFDNVITIVAYSLVLVLSRIGIELHDSFLFDLA